MKVDIENTENKYDVVYADPPWNYVQHGSKEKGRGMAEAHYETMRTEDICKFPVRNICTDQAVIFMWATFPNIKEAIKVMEAWGFTYKTAAFVWVKLNKKAPSLFWGMGAYTRANAEVCLIGISKGTRPGKMIKRHDIHSIIEAPVEEHSKKPDVVRKQIERLLGGGDMKKIELFARAEAEGWDCWGKEI